MLVAKQGFSVGRRVVRAGTLVDPSDPIVKGRESLFDEAVPIERATSAPGEKRTVKKTAKKTTKKQAKKKG